MTHRDDLRGHRVDEISRGLSMLAAASTAPDQATRAYYVGRARTHFAVARDRLAELERLLLAREEEIGRTTPPPETKT